MNDLRIAIYARYSSEQQREASLQDQIRNCQTVCERNGWRDPVIYQDAAISGTRPDRPEYQRLLTDAEAHRFDVLIVDDLSRLSRVDHETNRLVAQLRFWGIRLIGASDGVDTDQRGYKIQTGLRAIMNSIYLDDLAEKTHRGLMGQALAGQSAGGRSYGYRSEPVLRSGKIIGYRKVIEPEQAKWVRYIFRRFTEGASPRTIADELNRRRIPSPRGSTWAHSAIYGDQKRGLGMLNNPLYIGQVIWNRSQWIKDPVTGRRKRIERPASEWVIHEDESLRIVDQETWNRVKIRQAAASAKTRAWRRHNPRHSGGRGKPRYLFSGLLRCGCCGGNYVITDYYRYGCSTHKDRGPTVCPNGLKVRRTLIEEILLRYIKRDLLSEEAYQIFLDEVNRALQETAPDTTALERELAKAQQEIDNLMAAILAGVVTPTTKVALEEAEARKAAAEAQIDAARRIQPVKLLPKAKARWKALVERLSSLDDQDDIAGVRMEVQELLGEVTLFPNENGYLEAEIKQGRQLAALSEMVLVAGAGFEPTTFGL